MAKVSPLEVYKYLPGTNCRKCDADSCMAFASQLIERRKSYEDCEPLMSEEKYAEKRDKLIELVTPPVKEIVIGKGERACTLGGEEVMYRHELTFFNPVGFFIDLPDDMPSDELAERVSKIENFSVERVGQEITLDGIAVRDKTGDPNQFGEAVVTAVENSDLPLAICSLDPENMAMAVEIAAPKNPLLYAASDDNWEGMAEIAIEHSLPLVALAPKDIEGLGNLVQNLKSKGVEDIVLDIGTFPWGEEQGQTLENMAMMRRLAVEKREKLFGYPLLSVPMVAHMDGEDEIEAAREEALLASSQLLRFSDIMFLHSMEMFSLLPLLTLRQNIYTDPRVPIQVDPGFYPVGSPDENSPVLLTTNFALTYYTVASDVEGSQMDCYLLVVDTEGLAVEPAMAGSKLNGNLVKDAIQDSALDDKIKHKKLIIPGMAARISGEIEDLTGWEVMVGPIDSSRIKGFLAEKWS